MGISSGTVSSIDEFKDLVKEIEAQPGYQRPHAFGVGVARTDAKGGRLDTWYPHTNIGTNFGSAAVLANAVGHTSGTASYRLDRQQIGLALGHLKPFMNDGNTHPNIEALKKLDHLAIRATGDTRREILLTFMGAANDSVVDISDAYLRLHLLSHRHVKPNGINLEGLFGVLRNVAWTNEGPIALDELEDRRFDAMLRDKHLVVHSQDKFPPMLDYVTAPENVRITNARNVRLGAYLGGGTTVMTAGAINFNAGTEGPAMVEGRISAGVFVGRNSDLGGGASTAGTLSGGGKEKITIGEGCLIGANAGTGISLGDGCTIEAGLYVTPGLKVFQMDNGKTVKARTLSGQPNLLFRRDSASGRVEVINKTNTVGLNTALHKA